MLENVTIYNCIHSKQNQSFVNVVYVFDEGSIGFTDSLKLELINNFYGLPYKSVQISPITFGTENYFNKTGLILIITGETNTKLIIILYYESRLVRKLRFIKLNYNQL
jgi:hypothetical protein